MSYRISRFKKGDVCTWAHNNETHVMETSLWAIVDEQERVICYETTLYREIPGERGYHQDVMKPLFYLTLTDAIKSHRREPSHINGKALFPSTLIKVDEEWKPSPTS